MMLGFRVCILAILYSWARSGGHIYMQMTMRKPIRITRLTLILLVLVPHTALSQQFEAVRSYPVPEGEIRGIVLDANTDKPLVGATLTLVGADLRTRTDAHGRFVIRGVQHGSYTLRAQQTGYEVGRASVEMVPVVGWAARFSLRIDPDLD